MEFKDARALLQILLGVSQGEIGQLFDLTKLRPEQIEFERKYWLDLSHSNPDWALTEFFGRIGNLLAGQEFKVQTLISFVGIDQYWIINTKDHNEYTFRYRLGANRLPQLTVKFQVDKGSNLVRGEINLGVGSENPENIRAFMAVICSISDSYELFSIQQSGNIWIIEGEEGQTFEIVAYKVARIFPPEKLECFAEIEPYHVKDPHQALKLIHECEGLLGLSNNVCEQSIGEIFRPGKLSPKV